MLFRETFQQTLAKCNSLAEVYFVISNFFTFQFSSASSPPGFWDAYHLLCPPLGSWWTYSFIFHNSKPWNIWQSCVFLVGAKLSRWVLIAASAWTEEIIPLTSLTQAHIFPPSGSTSVHAFHPLIIQLPLWQLKFFLSDAGFISPNSKEIHFEISSE